MADQPIPRARPDPASSQAHHAAVLAAARRIVVKVGSSLLVDPDGGGLRRAWLQTLGRDIADLHGEGRRMAVVTSGAVTLGCQALGLRRSARLDLKQAAAAAGQPLLMKAWQDALAPAGIPTAQLLLTLEDTESRRRWLNARRTLDVLLASGAIPVVNENDSVATAELRYGDNDRLSARVAQLMQGDVLVLLSDVDGVYSADPARDPAARHIARIGEIDKAIEQAAGGAHALGPGSGGMRTKIAAARVARAFGCATIIACGRGDHPLRALASGQDRASVIDAAGSPARAYKQWIAGTLVPAGTVTLDAGAVQALKAGKSLLPSGALGLDGAFERGACLRLLAEDGAEIARGIAAYSQREMQAILGCPSSEIEGRIGYRGPDELIHRDDLVLM